MLKDHPYRKLALSLRRSSLASSSLSSFSPPVSSPHITRVLGLTASYTYAIGEAKVKASLDTMCKELLVTNLEIATVEELQASRYHAFGSAAEVLLAPTSAKLSSPSFVSITTANSPAASHAAASPSFFSCASGGCSVPVGVVPEADRKPHVMGPIFFQRERCDQGTAFAMRIMACVRAMEKAIVDSSEHPSFSSPLPPSGNQAPRKWGAYAHKLARDVHGTNASMRSRGDGSSKCGSRCSRGGGGSVADNGVAKERDYGTAIINPPSQLKENRIVRPMLAEMEHWYEAVKTLVISWEEEEDEAVIILDMGGCGQRWRKATAGSTTRRASGCESEDGGAQEEEVAVWPGDVRQLMSSFWAAVPESFPRFEHFKQARMTGLYFLRKVFSS